MRGILITVLFLGSMANAQGVKIPTYRCKAKETRVTMRGVYIAMHCTKRAKLY